MNSFKYSIYYIKSYSHNTYTTHICVIHNIYEINIYLIIVYTLTNATLLLYRSIVLKVELNFLSDGSETKSGFKLEYTAVDATQGLASTRAMRITITNYFTLCLHRVVNNMINFYLL